MSVVEPGWLPDPTGRHEFRWWDGTAWSDIVADRGVETVDRLDAQAPAAGPGPGPQPQPQPQPQPTSPQGSNRQIALVAGIGVVALLVVGIVAVAANRGGGSDGADAAGTPDPREALITVDDLPGEWQETESPPGVAENLICEPGLDSADPPRETEVVFERDDGSTWLSHVLFETSPQFASDVLEEHQRQAGQCGTFEEENTVEGDTVRSTITPEVLSGPTFGDETLWYVLHIENEVPQRNSADFLRCLDRNGGVISAVTLSVRAPLGDADQTLVEDLAGTVSDQLQG